MNGRAERAVTAAEHIAALRAIGESCGIEAGVAVQDAGRAYRRVLYSIGLIPGGRTDEVYDAAVTGSVHGARERIGA